MTRITVIFAALTLAACSKDGGDTGGSAAGDAAAGEAVYTSSCASCHGADGKLGADVGGTASADLTVEVPDQTDAELTDISQNGYGAMPAIGVSDADMPDLIAYLRATFP